MSPVYWFPLLLLGVVALMYAADHFVRWCRAERLVCETFRRVAEVKEAQAEVIARLLVARAEAKAFGEDVRVFRVPFAWMEQVDYSRALFVEPAGAVCIQTPVGFITLRPDPHLDDVAIPVPPSVDQPQEMASNPMHT